MKIKYFKNIFIIGVVAGAIYFLPKYVGVVQKAGVKGESTKKAQEISSQIGFDINSEVTHAKKQILNVKISDIIDGASKLSRISQDIKNGQEYIKEQIGNMIKSKDYFQELFNRVYSTLQKSGLSIQKSYNYGFIHATS